jgi:type I restriction enzyme M protein
MNTTNMPSFKAAFQALNSSRYQQHQSEIVGLIFYRFIDHQFEQTEPIIQAQLKAMSERRRSRADLRTLYQAAGVNYIPAAARFKTLANLALQERRSKPLGVQINLAIEALEVENIGLRDTISKNYDQIEEGILEATLKVISEIECDEAGKPLPELFDALIVYDAENKGRRYGGGENVSPAGLNNLIAALLQPTNGRMLDPALGAGGSLLALAHAATQNNPKAKFVLNGLERNGDSVRLARMSLALHGYEVDARPIDSLTDDPFKAQGKFDFIASVPPFNLQIGQVEQLKNDPRYPHGVSKNGNLMWAQLVVSSLNESGRGCVVLTRGAGLSMGQELEIRRKMIQSGVISAVIDLPAKLLSNTMIPLSLWLFDKSRTTDDHVLFVNGEPLHEKGRLQNTLTNDHISFISGIVRLHRGESFEPLKGTVAFEGEAEDRSFAELFPQGRYKDQVGLCRVATFAEIEKSNWSLSAGQYVGDEKLLELSALVLNQPNLKTIILKEVTLAFNRPKREREEVEAFEELENCVYLFERGEREVRQLMPDKGRFWIQIHLDLTKALASYVVHFLNSQYGVRLRQMSQGGTTIRQLGRRQMERLEIPLLSIEEQTGIIEVRGRLAEFETIIASMRNSFYVDPFSVKEIGRTLDQIEGNMTGAGEEGQPADQSFIEISFDQWIASLPFPLATILATYKAERSDNQKMAHLLNFFEAFSQFMLTLLLGGLVNDPSFFEADIRPQMAEKFVGRFATWYMSPSFGNRNRVAGFFAKRVRDRLNNKDTADHALRLFNQPDPTFLQALTTKELIPILEHVAKIRNKHSGHTGYKDDQTVGPILAELEDLLERVRSIIGPAFQTVKLVRPVPKGIDKHRGVYTCDIEVVHSANTFFEQDTIQSSSDLDSAYLYLWMGHHADPLPLPPLIELQEVNGALNCYYYNKTVKDKGSGRCTIEWICYHKSADPAVEREDPTFAAELDQIFTIELTN